jgi:hypothetical protein
MIRSPKLPAISSPEQYGAVAGLADRALARFALWAATQAARGVYHVGDAKELLTRFNASRTATSGKQYQLVQHKVTKSKFNKILEAGASYKLAAITTLRTTSKVYLNEMQSHGYENKTKRKGNRKDNSEYDMLVRVAREIVDTGRTLTRAEIIDLLVY